MTNSWSMLYDEILKMDENDFTISMTDNSSGSIDLINPDDWKYNEEEILKELLEYIRGTYNQHYSAGDDKIQTLDLIEACGDGEAFCRATFSSMPLVMIRKALPVVIL